MDLAAFFRHSRNGRPSKRKRPARRPAFLTGFGSPATVSIRAGGRMLRAESLEGRALLTTVYVDNSLLVTADRDHSGGLSAGDQVTFGSGQTYQQADLTYDG